MYSKTLSPVDELTRSLDAAWYVDETDHVRFLAKQLDFDQSRREAIRDQAIALVKQVRAAQAGMAGAMEAFMREYDLSFQKRVWS